MRTYTDFWNMLGDMEFYTSQPVSTKRWIAEMDTATSTGRIQWQTVHNVSSCLTIRKPTGASTHAYRR